MEEARTLITFAPVEVEILFSVVVDTIVSVRFGPLTLLRVVVLPPDPEPQAAVEVDIFPELSVCKQRVPAPPNFGMRRELDALRVVMILPVISLKGSAGVTP